MTRAKESLKCAPDGTHSVKGVGQTAPNPEKFSDLNGIKVPLGKPVKVETKSALLYNE